MRHNARLVVKLVVVKLVVKLAVKLVKRTYRADHLWRHNVLAIFPALVRGRVVQVVC